MSAQLSYNFATPWGAAGGIVDLAPYEIDTFINGEDTGVLGFGMAACVGTTAGVDIKLPASNAAVFEGVTVNNRSTEYDLEGNIRIVNKAAVGVMRYGRVYVQLASGATPAFNDPVYFVYSGDDKGKFTDSSSSTVAINARFISGADNGIAMIELQQPNIVDAT